MTTRQTIQNLHNPNNPVDHLKSGYDNNNIPSDFTIPSCGIEDAEVALHNLFDKEIGFTSRTVKGRSGPIQMNKPNVYFAAGERFAISKKLRPTRDLNNALLLPLISIRRLSIEQTSEDITQRGINQHTGELIIKKRLDSSDMDYQNLLNRYIFKNLPTDGSVPTSRRQQLSGSIDSELSERGALLEPLLNQNVYEIISIPQPQFYTGNYEVIFWTTHFLHMNYLIETFMSSFLPQGKMFRLETSKGYWFMAYVEDTMSSQDNVEDFTDQEKLVRYSFNVKIKGYILAVQHPTNAVPVRRTISAPQVFFEIQTAPGAVESKKAVERPNSTGDQFILTDIELNSETTQPETTAEKFLLKKQITNPRKGTVQTKYIQISDQNKRKGETIYKASDLETIMEMLFDKKEPAK